MSYVGRINPIYNARASDARSLSRREVFHRNIPYPRVCNPVGVYGENRFIESWAEFHQQNKMIAHLSLSLCGIFPLQGAVRDHD